MSNNKSDNLKKNKHDLLHEISNETCKAEFHNFMSKNKFSQKQIIDGIRRAIYEEKFDFIDTLLHASVKNDEMSINELNTCLFYAVRTQVTSLVKKIVGFYYLKEVSAKVLVTAVVSRQEEMIEYLLPLTKKDENYFTPLNVASLNLYVRGVEMLAPIVNKKGILASLINSGGGDNSSPNNNQKLNKIIDTLLSQIKSVEDIKYIEKELLKDREGFKSNDMLHYLLKQNTFYLEKVKMIKEKLILTKEINDTKDVNKEIGKRSYKI